MKKIKNLYAQRPVVYTLVMIGLATVVVVVVFQMLLKVITLHGQEYEVPEFVDMNISELESFKENENKESFEFVTVDSVFFPDKTGGLIVMQDPVSGSKVKKGRKIYLTITTFGKPQIPMPDLVDLSLRHAKNILISSKFDLEQVIYKPSDYHNAVLEQRYKGVIVKSGTMLPYQSKITLVVGKSGGYSE